VKHSDDIGPESVRERRDALESLDYLHHFALQTRDREATAEFLTRYARCREVWHDQTFILLKFANIQFALVEPGEHPNHLCIVRTEVEVQSSGPLADHRDGTRSRYVGAPSSVQLDIEVLASESLVTG
jgi:hypothetical protein